MNAHPHFSQELLRGRMPWLNAIEVAELSQVLGPRLAPFRVRDVYASGSFSVGYGNQTSDIDLVAVLSDGKLSADARTMDFALGQRTCDIEFYGMDELGSAVTRVNAFELQANAYDRVLRLGSDLRVVGRLRHSVPMMDDPMVAELRGQIDHVKLARLFNQFWSAESITWIRDTVGCLGADDVATALETSYQALWSAAESLVPAMGLTFMSHKYLHTRLDTLASQELAAQVLELLHPIDGRAAGELINMRLAVAAHCTALAGPAMAFPTASPRHALPKYEAATHGWTRTPGYAACWLSESVILGGASGRQVPRAIAMVWASLEGQTATTLTEALTARTRGADEASLIVQRALLALKAAGLASDLDDLR